MLKLYTDGSGTGRPNREYGWAWILVEDDEVVASDYGGGRAATNNIAEAVAAIMGLSHIIDNSIKGKVTLLSDSQYCLSIANGTFSPKKNFEHCKVLRKLFKSLDAETMWVKGHGGDEFNFLCDGLARMGRMKFTRKKC